jgi:hypothetical protein
LCLRAGTTLGDPWQEDNKARVLEWNVRGLNQAKKAQLHKTLGDDEIDVFVYQKPVLEERMYF